MTSCHRGERFVRALQDALRADVDPAAGRHLAVHRQTFVFEIAERVPRGPVRHQVGVGDQDSRRVSRGAEHGDRLAGLHDQRFVVGERAQFLDDGIKRGPRTCRLARAAIHDEIVRPLGDVGIEVVHQHPQGGLLWPSLTRQRRAAGSADGASNRSHQQQTAWEGEKLKIRN